MGVVGRCYLYFQAETKGPMPRAAGARGPGGAGAGEQDVGRGLVTAWTFHNSRRN